MHHDVTSISAKSIHRGRRNKPCSDGNTENTLENLCVAVYLLSFTTGGGGHKVPAAQII